MFFPTGFKQGFCRDEDGKDIGWEVPNRKEITNAKIQGIEDCVEYCMSQPLVTACEFNKVSNNEKCVAHIFTVGRTTNGDKNGLCSVILPKGL